MTLAWDANSEDNLAGYKLYYKTDTSGSPYDGTGLAEGDSPVTITLEELSDTSAPVFTLTGLEEGKEYFFALTAFNSDGLESDYSDEVAYEAGTAASSTLNLTASATGQGTISPAGSVSVSEGDSQTFTIVASDNYHIAGVTVDGISVGQVASYTFENVSTDHTISAVFEIDTYTVTATAGDNGAISPEGVTNVAYGESLGFAITPADGYHVSDVVVDGSSVGAVSAYSFENISTWHTIGAVFEADVVEDTGGGIVVDDGTSDSSDGTTDDTATGDTSDSTQDTTDPDTSDTDSETDQAVPGTPVAVSDTLEQDTLGSVELALESFSCADTGGTHVETEWQVLRLEDDLCVLSVVSGTALTTFTVPGIMLEESTAYYWKARFIDSDGLVSDWSQAAHFTTGASLTDTDGNGVHDEQEADITVDLNQDGIPDVEQEIIKSIVLPATGQPMGLDIEASETVMAILYMEAVDTDNMPVPDNVKLRVKKMPTGLINYKLAVAEPGDTAVVTIRFAEAVHPNAKWMKLDVITGAWTDYSGYCQLSDDRMSMTVELVDGGYGDDDGVANGIIVDPAGLEMVVSGDDEDTDTIAETVSDVTETSGGSDSGGGCFITGSVGDGISGAATATVGIFLLIALLGGLLVPARGQKRK